MTKVFIVQHVHTREDGAEDVKFIGVYSSRDQAQAAVKRMQCVTGFAEAVDGFSIDEYPVDKDHWGEGYVTVAEEVRLESR